MREALWPEDDGDWHATGRSKKSWLAGLKMPLAVLVAVDERRLPDWIRGIVHPPLRRGLRDGSVAYLEGW